MMELSMSLSKVFIKATVREFNRKIIKSQEHEKLAETLEMEANAVRGSIPKDVFDTALAEAKAETFNEKTLAK
jgi:hypothetical protein